MSEHESGLLGAYVLGVLDENEQDTVRKHLDGCEACRREVGDLQEMEAALGEVPPEMLIDGPPPDGELLLQRTLREVRGRRSRDERTRYAVWGVAAAVAAVAVLAGGTLIGRATAPSEPVAQPPIAPTAAPTPSAVVRTASGTDAATGASMTVAVQNAAGWVRLRAAVSGVPAGEQCRLVVVSRTGERRDAGSWLVSEAAESAGTTIDGAALIAPEEVGSVLVETFAGRPLVSVAI
jgi:anti-sigma factor RsiW